MEWINFLHLLGAIAAGYYLLMPFMAARMDRFSVTVQVGYLRGLFMFNRVGQYILVAQFLTGGYLISQAPYSVVWIVLVIVIFVLAAALAGMMSRPMKQLREHLENGRKDRNLLNRIRIYSAVIAVAILLLIGLMAFPF